MPELPEVETVRDGLARHVLGRVVTEVEVLRDYSVRRHDGGPTGLCDQLLGRRLVAAVRRGKYLWLVLDDDAALLAHLGMSGQLLVRSGDSAAVRSPHLRVRIVLSSAGTADTAGTVPEPVPGPLVIDFVDQRTFGHLSVQDLVPTPDGAPGGLGSDLPALPVPVVHIARDLLDPALRIEDVVAAVRRRRTGIKRALLDQTVTSGVGNIYADEALWRARLHFARATDTLRRTEAIRLLDAAREVMTEALSQGGTSFDALYVDVNGRSGYFSRSLAVYGQEGEPCPRCGTPVRRDEFMNRSAYTCPRCQPRPRNGRW
ncbi:bifunctional DNA-formamidopyrimidine glycosylase/DNA-(apurinic or apyrimidinic site) lyase [Cellulosimicrobium arenosum]|uniref:Bifunctional DNA-formamidopyrimidine glycosylase/DNA-(Apurinic or apyrimidinic site) lyase n=1 Tax=Cellulosimicrobium arenosum TaxID=2708133 RepID=A0A927J2K0_9MICO|nr:bifunctional DNA-formamidopyrimidine glycosylase/DNA-(apurinic or apyrimidinic site) lyase [Cellulosimicrobium arenosum]